MSSDELIGKGYRERMGTGVHCVLEFAVGFLKGFYFETISGFFGSRIGVLGEAYSLSGYFLF